MSTLLTRIRRMGQARSPQTDAQEAAAMDAQADRRTVATLCACMAAAQTALQAALSGVDAAGRALWQAAALQAVPLLALYALWRWVMRRAAPLLARRIGGARRFALLGAPALLLLPCLWLDGGVLLLSLTALSRQTLSPQLPRLAAGGLAALFALVSAVLGARRGVPCTAMLLRRLLPAALVACTALAGLGASVNSLFPLGGYGLPATARATLELSGCVWTVGLYALCSLRAAAATPSPDKAAQKDAPRERPRKAVFRRTKADAQGAMPSILAVDGYAAPAQAPGRNPPVPSPARGLSTSTLPQFGVAWLAGLWYAAFLCLCQPWQSGQMPLSRRMTALTRPAVVSLCSHAFPVFLALLCALALCGCAWAAPGLLLQQQKRRDSAGYATLMGLAALLPPAALLLAPPDAALATLCQLSWLRLPLCALAGAIALFSTLGGRRTT